MFATSEPGVNPSGTLLVNPPHPLLANLSIFGVLAYCKGVIPSNSSTG